MWVDIARWRLGGELVRLMDLDSEAPADRVVVGVHGLADSFGSWEPLARELGGMVRFQALDLPWRNSGGGRWNTDWDAVAWLAAALHRLPRPPLAVIAHSLGAAALLDVLSSRAAAVNAAVLLAPLYRPRLDAGDAGPDAEQDAMRRLLLESVRDGLSRRRLRSVSQGHAFPADADDLDADTLLDLLAARAVDGIGADGWRELHRLGRRTHERPIADVPMLMIHGPLDRCADPDALARLTRESAKRRLMSSSRWGHFSHLDDAETLAPVILDFLGSLPEPGGGAGAVDRVPG